MKSDRQLQEDVLAELAYEQSVNSAHIGVTAKDGVVTLTGIVKTFSEKRGAETATKRVVGVRGIAEELKVELPLLHRRNDGDIAQAALHATRTGRTRGSDARRSHLVASGSSTTTRHHRPVRARRC